jgi:hypothetical protein
MVIPWATLDSEINVAPVFINLGFFSRPYCLIKGPTFIIFWNSFTVVAVHLFVLPKFPGPTFIPCPTSIRESRVA